MTLLRVALVGLAGALGATARYWISTTVGTRAALHTADGARPFPWATLGINVLGAFLLGLVLGGPGAARWSATTTTAVTVGFLGAFTTFSTFAFETTDLVRANRPGTALAYVASSLLLGLAASAFGFVVVRP